jgi:hypothetical protein
LRTAEANEQGGDDVVGGERGEQRRQLHRFVPALVRESKRWSDNNGFVGQLDRGRSAGIDRPPLLAFERGQPLAHVLAPDEAPEAADWASPLGGSPCGGRAGPAGVA